MKKTEYLATKKAQVLIALANSLSNLTVLLAPGSPYLPVILSLFAS